MQKYVRTVVNGKLSCDPFQSCDLHVLSVLISPTQHLNMTTSNFVIFLALACVAGSRACRFPPSLWCSSPEIARECKVELHCEKYVWSANHAAPLVSFTLYMESLCPDCKDFVRTQLWPTWKAVGEIMNLTLVPYGNAREQKVGDQWKFQCQHGPNECDGNLIETCAIHILKNASLYFPFVNCIEDSKEIPKVSAPKCAQQFKIDYSKIMQCFHSPLGNKLEHQMALKTNNLNPPHTFVPWVTLNGVHTEKIQDEAQSNLLKLICDTYQGPKPPACSAEHLYSCYKN